MRHGGANPILIAVVSTTAALTFVTAFSTPLLSQQRRIDSGLPSNAEARARSEHQLEMDIEREALLKGSKPTRSIDQRQLQALTAQIKQDFERLWTLNSEVMARSTTKIESDYEYVLVRVTEIKSRAIRLQNTLSLPKSEDDEKIAKNQSARDPEELSAMLLLLNSRIVGFVTNDYFKKPKVLDAKLLSRASRDLEAIIELSRSIRKSAEKLNKILEKSP